MFLDFILYGFLVTFSKHAETSLLSRSLKSFVQSRLSQHDSNRASRVKSYQSTVRVTTQVWREMFGMIGQNSAMQPPIADEAEGWPDQSVRRGMMIKTAGLFAPPCILHIPERYSFRVRAKISRCRRMAVAILITLNALEEYRLLAFVRLGFQDS